jgi:hypothetical protein
MSHFAFLLAEWPAIHESATKAEGSAYPDPRAACFYARRTLELVATWMFKHDPALTLPYQSNLSALIHAPTFKKAAGLDGKMAAEGTAGAVGEVAVGFPYPETEAELRRATTDLLHAEVAAMNMDNFIVRPRRQVVESYQKPEAWLKLTDAKLSELAEEVAGLPHELPADPEEAKRFDLLILNLQLAMLRAEPGFERLRAQVKAIAGLLAEKSTIPMVHQQMPLIEDLQADTWWEDVTAATLRLPTRAPTAAGVPPEKQAAIALTSRAWSLR